MESQVWSTRCACDIRLEFDTCLSYVLGMFRETTTVRVNTGQYEIHKMQPSVVSFQASPDHQLSFFLISFQKETI